MGWDLTILATVVLCFGVVSRRLHGGVLTPAIIFVVVGYLLGADGLDVFEAEPDTEAVRLLAEITLTLVLFTDASAVSTRTLRHEVGFPARLLGVGLPLTILAGTAVAVVLFPALGVFEALVLAVLLAPTDAALGQTVVSDTRLPSRLRQGLSVESGLNDGICVPVLFAAISFAELAERPDFDGAILVALVEEVGIATGVGIGVAVAVSFLVRESARRQWMDEDWAQLVPISAATIAYTSTVELGGSGFIAAFVAGLLYGRLLGRQTAHRSTRFAEELGGLLSGVTFFVFGAVVIGSAVTDLDVETVVYAVLSLTALRMIPVAVALAGSAGVRTAMFAGWFGPRGLATIVFALIVVEDAALPHTDLIVQVAMVTVAASVIAHGVSAAPLTDRYVAWLSSQASERPTPAAAPEPGGEPGPPPRRGAWHRSRPEGPN